MIEFTFRTADGPMVIQLNTPVATPWRAPRRRRASTRSSPPCPRPLPPPRSLATWSWRAEERSIRPFTLSSDQLVNEHLHDPLEALEKA